jgi:hypothetical protein
MDNSGSADTKFKKGQKSGPGRPKGATNKVNGQLKEMILQALEGAGGIEYLERRANDPKTAAAFLGLVGKVLPMTIAGAAGEPPVRHMIEIGIVDHKG